MRLEGGAADGGPGIHRAAEHRPPDATGPERPRTAAAAYRRFLSEPGVENEFLAMRALAQRARSAARERRRLRERAAGAEVESGRLARAHDPDERGRLSFATGTAVALGLALVDAVPAYLAAQAFGLDRWTTIGISAVLVSALAAAMWVVAQEQPAAPRWAVVAALAVGLAALGALRWWYLVVTTGDETAAVLEAIGLTVLTGLLIWFGVIVLGLTRPRAVSAAERRARSLRWRAARAAVAEAEAGRRADAAMRELMGRAQLLAGRELDDPEARVLLLEQVRLEVDRDSDLLPGG